MTTTANVANKQGASEAEDIDLSGRSLTSTPDTNPGEQWRTPTTSCKREYAYLQEFLNISEQPRH